MSDPIRPGSPQPNQLEALETVRSEKFFKVYANAANLEMTAWDFKIIFGELRKSGDKVVIEQSVEVTMSPQHTKALAGVLINHVKEYEKHIGEIKLPQPPEAQKEAQSPVPIASVGFKTN